jgi:hypothetical protein
MFEDPTFLKLNKLFKSDGIVSESKSDRHHLLALFSALSAKQGIQIIT